MQTSPLTKTLSTESTSGLLAIGSGNNLRQIPSAPFLDSSKRRFSEDSEEDSPVKIKKPKQSHLNLLGSRFKIEDQMLGFGSFGRTF
jgi:hypothetical protein